MLKKLTEIRDDPKARDPYFEKKEKRAKAREQLKHWAYNPWQSNRFKFADGIEESTAREMIKRARRKYRRAYSLQQEEDGLYCYNIPMKQRYPWKDLEVGGYFIMNCSVSGAHRLIKVNARKLNRNLKLAKMGDELRCYRKEGEYTVGGYPWARMEVNESFEMDDVSSLASARSMTARANKRYWPRRFWVEEVDEREFVVWRIK